MANPDPHHHADTLNNTPSVWNDFVQNLTQGHGSAPKVGKRYLLGDVLVIASGAVMGNVSKMFSGLMGLFQSIGFVAGAEKPKEVLIENLSKDVESAINRSNHAIKQEGLKLAHFDDAELGNFIKHHSQYDSLTITRQAVANNGVDYGAWSMVAAGASMVWSGIFGRKKHFDETSQTMLPIFGEITNGIGNMVGFALQTSHVQKWFGKEKPEGYGNYQVNPDQPLPEMLGNIARAGVFALRNPSQAFSTLKDMFHYDPSELGKYILATTSLSGLMAGIQELARGDTRSRLAGSLQTGASLAYLWGELAMGNISEERRQGVIHDGDIALLKQAGIFDHAIQSAQHADWLSTDSPSTNDRILDILATEIIATRHKVTTSPDLIRDALAEALPRHLTLGAAHGT